VGLKEVEVDGVGMDDDVEGAEDGGFREIFEGCWRETEKGRRRCIHHSLPKEQHPSRKVSSPFMSLAHTLFLQVAAEAGPGPPHVVPKK